MLSFISAGPAGQPKPAWSISRMYSDNEFLFLLLIFTIYFLHR